MQLGKPWLATKKPRFGFEDANCATHHGSKQNFELKLRSGEPNGDQLAWTLHTLQNMHKPGYGWKTSRFSRLRCFVQFFLGFREKTYNNENHEKFPGVGFSRITIIYNHRSMKLFFLITTRVPRLKRGYLRETLTWHSVGSWEEHPAFMERIGERNP